jgi:phage-related protein (TIGR01555 family)
MGAVLNLFDRLQNALTGTGTRRDVRSGNSYTATVLSQHDIVAAYKGSGLLRKIIKIPALDMVREWRDWTGLDDDQAAKLYDEEKRLALRQKVRQAETLRGLGGGALILGLPGYPDQPAPETVAAGGLKFVHVVSRWHLRFDALQDDAREPGYGEPLMWRLTTGTGDDPIHPSRVIPFRCDNSAELVATIGSSDDFFWGESTVAQVLDAVQDNDAARAAFAALAHKARLLRIGIPGLLSLSASPEGEGQVMKRLAILATAESIHNATIYDAGDEEGNGGEKIDDVTYSFAGAKDILNAYGEFVAAISDIPATRLLGRAPEGMNSSGESQQKDWNKKVRALQTLDLAPCLDRLDRYLVPSAIGSAAKDAAYDFAPLDTPGEKERAETFKLGAEAIEKVAMLAAVPDRALARGVQSWLVEEGYLPELEAALGEMSDDERYGIEADLDGDDDDLKGGDPLSAGGGGTGEPARRAANDARFLADAAPKTLYVSRKVINAAEITRWAKGQGLETTLAVDDMHVTIAFSRAPVDWFEVGSDWSGDENGVLRVKPGGPRTVERLGDGDAVALLFQNDELGWRHRRIREAGASWDWPEYRPHITLSWNAPGADVAQIEPYTGPIVLGPELFAEVVENWKEKIEEA